MEKLYILIKSGLSVRFFLIWIISFCLLLAYLYFMQRRQFVKNSVLSLLAMTSLKDLEKLSNTFTTHESKMPLLFVGHGNPMNAIEDNEFSKKWQSLGKELIKPQA